MSKKVILLNYIFSFLNILVSTIQSLWLVSYVQKAMGVEAYGYIAIITNFVNMANVITIAFTTYTSRYVSIELHNKNIKQANKYFNSSLFGLFYICCILSIVFFFLIYNLRYWLNVNDEFILQVQLLLIFIGGSFLISTLTTPLKSGLYFANKIYIMHGFQILSYLCRIGFTLILSNIYSSKIWYAYLGSFFIDLISLYVYFVIYKRLLPGVSISHKKLSFKAIKEILKSGIYLSINKGGAILLTNINIYITSIIISIYMTGIYSTVNQFVSLLSVATMTLISTFVPEIYSIYSKNDKARMSVYINKQTKLLSILIGFTVGGMLVFGKYFLILMVSKEYIKYGLIIVFILIHVPLTYPVNILEQLLITYNKFSIPALTQLVSGVANIILIIVFNKIFNIGIYSILIVSIIVSIIKDMLFIPIYTSKATGYSIKKYYKNIIIGVITMLVTIFFSKRLVIYKNPNSWVIFSIEVFVVVIIALIIFYFINILKEKGIVSKLSNIFRKKNI